MNWVEWRADMDWINEREGEQMNKQPKSSTNERTCHINCMKFYIYTANCSRTHRHTHAQHLQQQSIISFIVCQWTCNTCTNHKLIIRLVIGVFIVLCCALLCSAVIWMFEHNLHKCASSSSSSSSRMATLVCLNCHIRNDIILLSEA